MAKVCSKRNRFFIILVFRVSRSGGPTNPPTFALFREPVFTIHVPLKSAGSTGGARLRTRRSVVVNRFGHCHNSIGERAFTGPDDVHLHTAAFGSAECTRGVAA